MERSKIYKDSLENKDTLDLIVKQQQSEQDSLAMVTNVNSSSVPKAKERHYKSVSNSILNIDFVESEIDSMIAAGASDQEIYKKTGMKPDAGFISKRPYKQVLKFVKNKSGGTILQTFYDSIPLAMFILLPIIVLILKVFYFRKGRCAHHLVFNFYFFCLSFYSI